MAGTPEEGRRRPRCRGHQHVQPEIDVRHVCGRSSNRRFTYAAALAVAEQPGVAYNPLFLSAASVWARRT